MKVTEVKTPMKANILSWRFNTQPSRPFAETYLDTVGIIHFCVSRRRNINVRTRRSMYHVNILGLEIHLIRLIFIITIPLPQVKNHQY
ncbi:uncharacterized protein CYBJADRAFT_86357 [Cyberlindnera jadinii NRRL Y-1542]|uniref:Uncharacterized protein n=1 Tax=Cyberlindnera jadinii (strain ATCC 18201 / CBS 1600 / BCRC 20928 / JCM 3617 / NBRC 0987 / NRRL Y-1542) TaxID=983966 RepID=A0A1E4S266_CYBJN|nr:hypothetical protein CYBJADRAFT_86357 [Cyberlindnera jadinii NRRL Y-1542]ODV73560.1 hypothetical protein CYBJADRAFT_86357 [Cyberlindnera jadinii NRRL Y-1542]